MAIAVNDVLRLGCQFVAAGTGEFVNVHHAKVQSLIGTPSDADIIDDIIDQLNSEFYAAAAPATSDTVVGGLVTTKNITTSALYPARPNITYSSGGAVESMSAQTAPLLFWQTSVSRVQKRTYLPPLTQASAADYGLYATGVAAGLLSGAANLLAPLAGAVGTYLIGVWSPTLATFLPLITAAIGGGVRTQRRRTVGRGS